VVYTIAGLVLAASLGLRMQEQSQRKLFASVVQERTKRVSAEFQRERSSVPKFFRGTRSTFSASRSHGSDAAETSDTAGAFEKVKAAGSEEALAVLEGVGLREHWLIHDEELIVPLPLTVLGRGGCGMVVEGTFCHAPVAVKLFRRELNLTTNRTCINELRFLRHLRHPNIVSFIGAQFGLNSDGQMKNDLKLVMEKVVGKPFQEYLRHCDTSGGSKAGSHDLPNCEARNRVKIVVQGVLRALIYLHSRKPPVVHSDLKPSNIVVVENLAAEPVAKLLDFGLTRAVTRRAIVRGGTDSLMAPETYTSFDGTKAMPAIDIYSLGRILSLSAVFGECGETPDPGSAACTPQLEEWRSVIMKCLSHDPHQRPTALGVYLELFAGSQQSAASQGPASSQQCLASAQGPAPIVIGRSDADAGSNSTGISSVPFRPGQSTNHPVLQL
jgi:serine/threonine protein kinase